MATLAANIRGPAGAKGATGDKGATGNKGATGATGNPGPVGNPGQTQVSTNSGNQANLGTDSKIWVPSQPPPLATTSNNGLVAAVSGKSTDYLTGQNSCADLGADIRPQIYKVRQLNINSVGNPNFMVNARQPQTHSGGGGWCCDRWLYWGSGAVGTAHTSAWSSQTGGWFTLNGYFVTNSAIYVQSTAVLASLAAGDGHTLYQAVEGPMARELVGVPTSISLLCYCTQPLKFCCALRGAGATYSYCHLCTIPTANTATLIQIPNIPAFSSSGNFPITSGSVCYNIMISVAMGSTWMAPQNDAWVAGNFYGAIGQDNMFSKPSGTIFYVAFVQHEPGPVCNYPVPIPFDKNLLACQRYYQKSYGYGTVSPGVTANPNTKLLGNWVGGTTVRCNIDFPVPMAIAPTMTFYGFNSTTANVVNFFSGGNIGVTSPSITPTCCYNFVLASTPGDVAPRPAMGQWEASTGW